ncbi:hypothetical protein [Leptolyngbya ohadii]|uniref:hypothetical protein n=1 Tax=Leptolyngbya ohadii TaxID=1962290 RepID=UPI000B59D529|nr:hypothetical protein [Leptolyngbya ohadii]
MPRTRSQTASKIAPDAIAQLNSVFDALPEKPRDTYTLRQAVTLLYAPLLTALSRGYSYEEIAVILSEQEIPISALSLKRYLSLSKSEQTQTSSGQGRRRRRKQEASVEAAPELAESTASSIESPTQLDPEPAPKRRGRSKAAPSEQPTLEAPVTVPADPQPEPEAIPKRRGRTSKTAAKSKPAVRTTTRTRKGRGRE